MYHTLKFFIQDALPLDCGYGPLEKKLDDGLDKWYPLTDILSVSYLLSSILKTQRHLNAG